MPLSSAQRKMEIVAIFQASIKRDNKSAIEELALAELRDADEMLGDRDINAGFRIALRNRIRDLETQAQLSEQRRHESHIRAWNLAVGIAAGVLITLLGTWITR